jgi:predicted nucleic acid-binding protein
MSTYLDANLLVRHYLDFNEGTTASLILANEGDAPYPITDILRLEARNAIQRRVFESKNGSPLRTTQEAAWAAIAQFEDDLASADLLRREPVAISDIENVFVSLADRYTAKHGFRTYDILHVASALHLGCTTFFSFDKKALELARLEGLQTN